MSIPVKRLQSYQKKFGSNLKKVREGKGYSQSSLAAISELEKTGISRIENGRTNVTLKTALQLSDALNVPLKSLFDLE